VACPLLTQADEEERSEAEHGRDRADANRPQAGVGTAFDRDVAPRDGRNRLGGDIMIHGARASDGCLAMGNETAEDLFVMAGLATDPRVRIIISPTDFRDPTSHVPTIVNPWLRELYLALRTELQQYRR